MLNSIYRLIYIYSLSHFNPNFEKKNLIISVLSYMFGV